VKQATLLCVWGFDLASEEFILLGAFTKREDADAFAALPETIAAAAAIRPRVIAMTLCELKAQLLRERLGQLHDVLLRIEAKGKAPA